MFCKQFLAYAVHIDWCYHSIHKHSSGSQHAPIWWHRGCIVVPSRVDIQFLYFRNNELTIEFLQGLPVCVIPRGVRACLLQLCGLLCEKLYSSTQFSRFVINRVLTCTYFLFECINFGTLWIRYFMLCLFNFSANGNYEITFTVHRQLFMDFKFLNLFSSNNFRLSLSKRPNGIGSLGCVFI